MNFSQAAVQSILAPFVASLAAAVVLGRVRLAGLALVAGLLTMLLLTGGFIFSPLTAARKIVASGLAAAAVGLVFDLLPGRLRGIRAVIVIAGALCAFWVFWSVARHRGLSFALFYAAIVPAYVAWLVASTDAFAESPLRAGVVGLALGVGTAGAAFFGTAYFLGELAAALAAASAGYLLVHLVRGAKGSCGRTFTLPLGLLLGLTGGEAVLLGILPWYLLGVLGMIPLAARVPLPKNRHNWLHAVSLVLLTLLFAAASIWLARKAVGGLPT